MVAESYTQQELIKKILEGVPVIPKADPKGPNPPLAMPPYRGLIGDEEMNDLVGYLMSLSQGAKRGKKEEW